MYDLKSTFKYHPDGINLFKKYVGTDCTDAFNAHKHPK